jgi:hypothetical protein
MKLTVMLLAGLLALPALAQAQSVDGKWMGEFTGGRGPQQITFTLKNDGGKLTGTVLGGRGGEIAIEEGTFAKGELKFKTKQMGRGGGEQIINWVGALKGDEIAFTRTVEGGQGQPLAFVAKRQK